MIDLDESLSRLRRAGGAEWGEDRAQELATELARRLGMWVQFEPSDEEWVLLQGDGPWAGMISTRYPLALMLPGVAPELSIMAPEMVVALIDGFLEENLRVSRELLRATVMSDGWSDLEFNSEAFSANDLFVMTV